MKYIYSILVLALLSGAVLGQVDSAAVASQWANKVVELSAKITLYQTVKNYWNAHADTVLITPRNSAWPFLEMPGIKWKTNAEFRGAVNDIITSLKAQRATAKDSTRVYSNGAK